MTIGENIRRIRKERGLSQKEVGKRCGYPDTSSDVRIRQYESNQRIPKPSNLEKIAKALDVNPSALKNSDFDGVEAMHMLFQIFQKYDGQLFDYKDKDGKSGVCVSFDSLPFMRSWFDRYEKYMEEVETCNEIKDVKKRKKALQKAESDFNSWMVTFDKKE